MRYNNLYKYYVHISVCVLPKLREATYDAVKDSVLTTDNMNPMSMSNCISDNYEVTGAINYLRVFISQIFNEYSNNGIPMNLQITWDQIS